MEFKILVTGKNEEVASDLHEHLVTDKGYTVVRCEPTNAAIFDTLLDESRGEEALQYIDLESWTRRYLSTAILRCGTWAPPTSPTSSSSSPGTTAGVQSSFLFRKRVESRKAQGLMTVFAAVFA